jgi:putative nucleotidyltransferase with HDIG domain
MEFSTELKKIKDEKKRETVRSVIVEILPIMRKYPASTTGRWHPIDENGPGGLILHSKRVAFLCVEACREFGWDNTICDEIIIAAIFHDIGRMKELPGYVGYCGHGAISSKYLHKKVFPRSFALADELMRCHMARWDPKSDTMFEDHHFIFAFCDYIASRPWARIPTLDECNVE